MGLDMYAFAVPAEKVEKVGQVDVDLDQLERSEVQQLHYWRKHHDLHGWMEQLYRNKGGTSQTFNCDTLRLLPEDLDALEQAVKNGWLPATTGFFFGNNPPDDDSRADDLEFIRKARAAIEAGKAVFYDSWW